MATILMSLWKNSRISLMYHGKTKLLWALSLEYFLKFQVLFFMIQIYLENEPITKLLKIKIYKCK